MHDSPDILCGKASWLAGLVLAFGRMVERKQIESELLRRAKRAHST